MVVFMKVLSLKEPFASLIKEGIKKVETRSFKTNYRGEIYIHASITKAKNDERDLFSLLQNTCFLYGHIICKCNLVDCVYMTKEYVNEIKMKNPIEYKCGLYEEGRYAWILDDVEVLEIPIEAKGQLGIWNFYNEEEIMDLMKNVEYGWIDKEYNKYTEVDELYSKKYILSSPQDVIKTKAGVCWDQTELERYYFKNTNYNIKTYFLCYYDSDTCPTHSFLVYEKNNKYYWFEHSWGKYRGIHEFNSLNELLKDVKNKFIKSTLSLDYNKDNLLLREYKKPKYHISVSDYYKHCESFEVINI